MLSGNYFKGLFVRARKHLSQKTIPRGDAEVMLLSEERGVSRHSGLIVKYSLLSTDVEVSRAGRW